MLIFLLIVHGSSVTKLVEKLNNIYLEEGGNNLVLKHLIISLLTDSTIQSSVDYTIN